MRKLRLRQLNQMARLHTGKQRSQNSIPSPPASEPIFMCFILLLPCSWATGLQKDVIKLMNGSMLLPPEKRELKARLNWMDQDCIPGLKR